MFSSKFENVKMDLNNTQRLINKFYSFFAYLPRVPSVLRCTDFQEYDMKFPERW